MKKFLAVIALAASLTALGAAAAQAADTYPAPAASVTVSVGTVRVGGTVTFSGSGFMPGEQIVITVSPGAASGAGGGTGAVSRSVPLRIPAANQTITAVADGAGAFSVDVVLTDAGVYNLTAVGASSGVTQTSTVTVAAPQPANAPASVPELAATGAAPGLMAWSIIGAGTLAAGAASVVVVRRRHREAVAS